MADRLVIADLHLRHSGVSRELAGAYYAVACVCLERHNTSSATVDFTVTGGPSGQLSVEWDNPSAESVRSFANVDEATRDAAYCVALAFVEEVGGLVALRRAEGKSGADYYLVPVGTKAGDDPHIDLERDDLARLEVSGVDRDTNARMESRLTSKLAQLRRGRSDVRGQAVVVGFRTPRIRAESA